MTNEHRATDPIALFRHWLADAEGLPRDRVPEPTAFALATCAGDGRPAVRMVLLKDVDPDGFVFYTNLQSRKGRDLTGNDRAAMVFHWAPLERQVRVEGRVTRVSETEADAYFATRARGSQIGAWASRQSQVVQRAGDLERRVAEVEARFAGVAVPRPDFWSGFRLTPETIEFWTGKPNRLHDRQLFVRAAGVWQVRTLYP